MDGKALLMLDEGNRAAVYDDRTGKALGPGSIVQGHPTIGVGIRLDGEGLTTGELTMLFDARYQRAILDAMALVGLAPWVACGAPRQAVIANMAYQLGKGGLQEFRAMLEAIKIQNWEVAATQALLSKAARETPLRWKRHAAILRSGQWPTIGPIA